MCKYELASPSSGDGSFLARVGTSLSRMFILPTYMRADGVGDSVGGIGPLHKCDCETS